MEHDVAISDAACPHTSQYGNVLSNVRCKNRYCLMIKVKVKVKQSRYRPGVAQRVPGS